MTHRRAINPTVQRRRRACCPSIRRKAELIYKDGRLVEQAVTE